jgi:hypothetical protein
MSQPDTDIHVQLTQAIGAINNLANELKHYTNIHEKHAAETKERFDKSEVKIEKQDVRLRVIEAQIPTFQDMKNSNQTIKNGVVTILLSMVVFGSLAAYFAIKGGS